MTGPNSPRRLWKRMALITPVVLLLWLAFWWRGGCLHGTDVEARVTFVGEADEITSVRIFAGGDKAWAPHLRRGETLRSALFPGAGDTRLMLQFTLDGQQRNWDGPELGQNVGYRMALSIDAQGRVTERHCVLPCWLN